MSPLATCTIAAPNEPKPIFRLIPAGVFRAVDGRPKGLQGWVMDQAAARAILDQFGNATTERVIDYEHQTLAAASNGKPNPAAGWFSRLEWRPGDGLYVMDARWTAAAAAMLRRGEYRYISPVFPFDSNSGRVLGVHSAALTNTPALDGLTDLAAAKQGAGNIRPTLTASSPPEDIARAALAYQSAELASGRFVPTERAVCHVTRKAGTN